MILQTGTVLTYPFLWSREHERGEESGRKPRPVAVVFNLGDKIGLVPVTSQPLSLRQAGVEIPDIEKHRGGLDLGKPLWVITTEMNLDDPGRSYYLESESVIGYFSPGFVNVLKAAIRQSLGNLKQVPRT